MKQNRDAQRIMYAAAGMAGIAAIFDLATGHWTWAIGVGLVAVLGTVWASKKQVH